MSCAQAGLDNQATILVVNETNVTRAYPGGQVEALSDVPVLYFKNCVGGTYTVDRKVKNVFVENCSECSITLNGAVLTRSAEVWHGGDLALHVNQDLRTLQVDMVAGLAVTFAHAHDFHAIVHNQVAHLSLAFLDAPEHTLLTGAAQMLRTYPDSNVTDQYIVRFIEGALLPERCVSVAQAGT